jgi:hypothetical protein
MTRFNRAGFPDSAREDHTIKHETQSGVMTCLPRLAHGNKRESGAQHMTDHGGIVASCITLIINAKVSKELRMTFE